ncbi:hypothetical protein BDZ89DRAFT_201252 [Hymenopellis radicata]|nr:hypothetical protein BDZ89DRAFT_201252 [Hymenopellis radicata]
MFNFCRHVTTRTLKLQRYLSSTSSVLQTKGNLRPFRMVLESVYKDDRYPSRERQEIVARDLGFPIKTISRWFCRRRDADKAARSVQGQDTSEFRGYERVPDEQSKIILDQCARNLYPSESELVDLAERLGTNKSRLSRRLSDIRYKARQGSLPTGIPLTVTPAKTKRKPYYKVAILEEHFQRDPYPKQTGTFDALVQKVELPPLKVKRWFDERRKKEHKNPVRPLTKVMDELLQRHLDKQ